VVRIPDSHSIRRLRHKKSQYRDKPAILVITFCTFWILFLPKAGVRVNGLPYLVSSFCFFVLVVFLILRRQSMGKQKHIFSYVLFATSWYGLIIFRNSDFQINTQNKVAALSWFLLSPVFWILASSFKLRAGSLNINVIYMYFLILSIFAISQHFFGLQFLQVPGLTIALGDSYESKNLSIFEGKNVVALKSPSTYQSGNLFGQVSAIVLVWIIELTSKKNYGSRKLRILMTAIISSALLLSFSRTAFLALVFGWLVYFSTSRSKSKGSLAVAPAFLLVFAFLEPITSNRFSFSNLTNDIGRTAVWLNALETYSVPDWLFGRVGPMPRNDIIMEGVIGILSQVGIIGLVLILYCWKKAGLMQWPGFTTAFWFCVSVDSTYYFAPFMWIPAILLIFGRNIAISKFARTEKY
jgi:hypothetical protein